MGVGSYILPVDLKELSKTNPWWYCTRFFQSRFPVQFCKARNGGTTPNHMIDRWFGIGLNGLIFLCLTLAKAPQARPSLYMVLDRSNSDGLWGEKRVWTLMILISTSLYKSAMVEREHQISSTIHCAIFNFMNFIFRFLLLQHFDISFVNSCLLLFFFLFNLWSVWDCYIFVFSFFYMTMWDGALKLSHPKQVHWCLWIWDYLFSGLIWTALK